MHRLSFDQSDSQLVRVPYLLGAAFIFVFMYLLTIAQLDAMKAAKASIYILIFGYAVGNGILGRAKDPITLTELLLFTFVGLMTCGVLDLLMLANNLDRAITFYLIFPLAIYGCYKSIRSDLVYRKPSWSSVGAGFLLFATLFNLAFSYLYPGRGPFAPAFINVDTPFYLSHTQALINETSWPVTSLNVSGIRMAYHYGVQNTAALISRFSGAPAHVSLYTVCCGLMIAVMAATLYSVANVLRGRWPQWLAIGLLSVFFVEFYPVLTQARFGRLFAPPNSIPHPGGLFGMTAVCCCLYALTVKASPAGRIIAPITIIAAASRTTNFMALLMGFSLDTFRKALSQRSLREAPLLLISIGAAALIIYSFAYSSSGGTLVISLGNLIKTAHYSENIHAALNAIASANHRVIYRSVLILVLSSIVPVCFVLATISFGIKPRGLRLDILCYIVPPLLFLNLVGFENVGFTLAPGEELPDFSVAFSSMLRAQVFFWWGLLLAYIGYHDWIRPTRAAAVAATLFMGIVGLSAIIVTTQTATLIKDPTKSYEFVDNRAIAKALSAVPLDDTLLVTNDIRYPAQNYARNNRQHQLSALFGHHNFASVLQYVPTTDRPERQRLNALLAAPTWDEELNDAATRYGWTHYLVRKAAPHPGDIPLRKVYEDDDYTVYAF
jgi:hypothetical protein